MQIINSEVYLKINMGRIGKNAYIRQFGKLLMNTAGKDQ